MIILMINYLQCLEFNPKCYTGLMTYILRSLNNKLINFTYIFNNKIQNSNNEWDNGSNRKRLLKYASVNSNFVYKLQYTLHTELLTIHSRQLKLQQS